VRLKACNFREVEVLLQEVFNSVSRRQLRRSDAGWGAVGGEIAVRRRQTRFGRMNVASLRSSGEART
jgi:hypothetical protein